MISNGFLYCMKVHVFRLKCHDERPVALLFHSNVFSDKLNFKLCHFFVKCATVTISSFQNALHVIFFSRLIHGFHCLSIFLMMSLYFGCISFLQVCTFPLYLHCTMRYSLHEIMLPTLPTDNAIWNDGWNCVKFKVKQYYILNAHVDLDLSFEDCLWIQTQLDARSSE